MRYYMKNIKILMFIFAIAVFIFCTGELNNNSEANINNKTEEQNEILDFKESYLSFGHPLKAVDMSIKLININISSDEETEEVENKEETPSDPYESYEFIKGWTIEYVEIKNEPNFDSTTLEIYSYNNEINYALYDEEWSVIKYKDNYAFVQTKYISNEKCNYEIVNVPQFDVYEGNKTWMPYTSISCVESPQYKLQQIAYTSTYGIRMYDGRYCIAVGTAITSDVGVYIDVILENGTVIPCIVGDIKADIHTYENNIFTLGSICCSEFIVDMNYIDSYIKITGNVSDACPEWDSKVVKFKVYNDIDIVDW